jgi:hypothetical protein
MLRYKIIFHRLTVFAVSHNQLDVRRSYSINNDKTIFYLAECFPHISQLFSATLFTPFDLTPILALCYHDFHCGALSMTVLGSGSTCLHGTALQALVVRKDQCDMNWVVEYHYPGIIYNVNVHT